MTAKDTGKAPRSTDGPEPVAGANDLAPPSGLRALPDSHGRHAAVVAADGQAVDAPGADLGGDAWQQEEIELDRRRERRLVWQSLVAFAVVAALVLAGRVQGW